MMKRLIHPNLKRMKRSTVVIIFFNKFTNLKLCLSDKWYDGLVDKDITISNEVYYLETVDFERQALHKLVRKVHSLQDRYDNTEDGKEKENATLAAAKKCIMILAGGAHKEWKPGNQSSSTAEESDST
ncbi:hypothetical protein AKJ16_DCAP21960 [Drosera capensis]